MAFIATKPHTTIVYHKAEKQDGNQPSHQQLDETSLLLNVHSLDMQLTPLVVSG